MSATRNVAVLMGGPSPEYEISCGSGRACAQALKDAGYQITEVLLKDSLTPLLEVSDRVDVVFNALHGAMGEDGCVQGVLEWLGLPYTHSGVLASALAMDKWAARRALQMHGLEVPQGQLCARDALPQAVSCAKPYVVKPISGGSTIGVHFVRQAQDLEKIAGDETLGAQVLVEEYIRGRELTVALRDGIPLAVTEIILPDAIFDYRSKYQAGLVHHLLPAPLSSAETAQILDLARQAHAVLGCRGVSRVDLRLATADAGGGIYILEVNTQPGMLTTSLVPEQARYCGWSMERLCAWMVEDASCNR